MKGVSLAFQYLVNTNPLGFANINPSIYRVARDGRKFQNRAYIYSDGEEYISLDELLYFAKTERNILEFTRFDKR